MKLSYIVEAMADFETKRGRHPTHIYVDVPFFQELDNYWCEHPELKGPYIGIFGMEIVICRELPMQRKGFFVTA